MDKLILAGVIRKSLIFGVMKELYQDNKESRENKFKNRPNLKSGGNYKVRNEKGEITDGKFVGRDGNNYRFDIEGENGDIQSVYTH